MNPIEIDPTSSHYRLATVYGYLTDYDIKNNADSCQYIRACVAGLFVIVGVLFFVTVMFLFPIGDTIGAIIAFLVTGYIEVTRGMTMLLFQMITALVGWFTVWWFLLRRKTKKNEETPPSVIKKLYHSFKDKYCIPVTVKLKD